MTIAKCVFCGKEEEDYKGVYLIKNEGSVNYYCSSKCKKNHVGLRRDRRKVRWTIAFHEQRKKRLEKAKEVAEKKVKEVKDKEKEASEKGKKK